jgi:acetyl esterase/lipase
MAAFTAEYRVKSLHGAEPLDGVLDAADAIRWIRRHAGELRVDPARIAAAGGSSGGHLAASTAVLQHTGIFGDAAGDSRPDALVLFNPALDTEVSGLRLMNGKEKLLSCIRHVGEGLPPTLIFHGTEDASVVAEQPRTFCRLMREHGNRCELIWFEGEAHGFFNPGRSNNVPYLQTLKLMEVFLSTLGFVKLG